MSASSLIFFALLACAAGDTGCPVDDETCVPDMDTRLIQKALSRSRKTKTHVSQPAPGCGYTANANIGWTGKETVSFVGQDSWSACCDDCTKKAGESPPCAAWVFIHDGHCYQKYDLGTKEVTLSPGGDSSGSDAGILTDKPSEYGYHYKANIGWTGKETVTYVGSEGWRACAKTCEAKAGESPPCAAWVFIHDGHCYQKYDLGTKEVTLSLGGDSAGSDAGILTDKPSDYGYHHNANIGWTGKETVTYVGAEGWRACAKTCEEKAVESPPCAAWVFIHDGHCYQKYDLGTKEVTLSLGGDSAGSDAGILP